MLLLYRDRKERKDKRHKEFVKGPASSKPVRLTEVTRGGAGVSQEMPNQPHGVSSLSFQEERD